jgi:putative spermidine/putrescine transport system permease protein
MESDVAAQRALTQPNSYDIAAMTTNITTPVLYALGTLTTVFSLGVVVLVTLLVLAMRRRVAA